MTTKELYEEAVRLWEAGIQTPETEAAFVAAAEKWALSIMTPAEMERSISSELKYGHGRAEALTVMLFG